MIPSFLTLAPGLRHPALPSPPSSALLLRDPAWGVLLSRALQLLACGRGHQSCSAEAMEELQVPGAGAWSRSRLAQPRLGSGGSEPASPGGLGPGSGAFPAYLWPWDPQAFLPACSNQPQVLHKQARSGPRPQGLPLEQSPLLFHLTRLVEGGVFMAVCC